MQDPLLSKLPRYNKKVSSPEIQSGETFTNKFVQKKIIIFQDNSKSSAQSLKASSAVAIDIYNDIAGIGTSEKFSENFNEINENNLVDVMAKYKRISGRSLIHDIAREYEVGGLSADDRISYISELKSMAKNRLQNSGMEFNELFNDFDKELATQSNSFGRISTDKLDKMFENMTDAIEVDDEIQKKSSQKFLDGRNAYQTKNILAYNDEYSYQKEEDDGNRFINLSDGYSESKQFLDNTCVSYLKKYSKSKNTSYNEFKSNETDKKLHELNVKTSTEKGDYLTNIKTINLKNERTTQSEIVLKQPSGNNFLETKINLKQIYISNMERKSERNGEQFNIVKVGDNLIIQKVAKNESVTIKMTPFLNTFNDEERAPIKSYLNSVSGDVLADIVFEFSSNDSDRIKNARSFIRQEAMGTTPQNKKFPKEMLKALDDETRIALREKRIKCSQVNYSQIYNACYSILTSGESKEEKFIYENYSNTLNEVKKRIDKIREMPPQARIEPEYSMW